MTTEPVPRVVDILRPLEHYGVRSSAVDGDVHLWQADGISGRQVWSVERSRRADRRMLRLIWNGEPIPVPAEST